MNLSTQGLVPAKSMRSWPGYSLQRRKRRRRRQGLRASSRGKSDRCRLVEGDQGRYEVEGGFFLTSNPLTDLIDTMQPHLPPKVLRALSRVAISRARWRQSVEGCPFPDHWIYVHSPEVTAARIANYRNFSPDMAAADNVSPLTVEYFSSPGDQFSLATDDALIARAVSELAQIGLIAPDQFHDGFVLRSENAYPVMRTGHQAHVAIIREWLQQFENLLPIGRSGMFKYNNQDHAMATGLLAARTSLGVAQFDPWSVNIDAEYAEAGKAN